MVGGACARRSGVEQWGCAAAHRAVRGRAGTAICVVLNIAYYCISCVEQSCCAQPSIYNTPLQNSPSIFYSLLVCHHTWKPPEQKHHHVEEYNKLYR